MKIGFIGLGIMGKPMVKNLLVSGFSVLAYDISAQAMETVKGYGAELAGDIAHLAQSCEVIFTMLPQSNHVEDVALGESGILYHAEPGTALIDTSSISPVASKTIAEKLAGNGILMIDAPVSGGELGAIKGTLSMMVGGEETVIDKVRPYLEAVSAEITHVGGNGAGCMVKLANQIMVNVNMAAMAEAVVFAEKAGIDTLKMYNAVKGGAAASAVLDEKIPKIVKGDYTAGGPISINAKDLQNVLDEGKLIKAPLPLTNQVLQMFHSLQNYGHDRTDHSGLVLYYEMLANIKQMS